MRAWRTSSLFAHTPPPARLGRWLSVPSALLMFAFCGCSGSGADEPYGPPPVGEEQIKVAMPALAGAADAADAGAASGTCTTGDARECKVTLASHGNVANCFVGVQICDNDAWGPCESPPKR
jgi:hypothetical protein